MKIFQSLDFKSQIARIEKNEPDEYQVHAEDYEDLNSLVRRAAKTKTKFKPEKVEGAIYDEEILQKAQEETINLFEQALNSEAGSGEVEQSEDETKPAAEEEAVQMP